jgi:hypothetical protein
VSVGVTVPSRSTTKGSLVTAVMASSSK